MVEILNKLIDLLSKTNGLTIQVISSLLNQPCSVIKNLIWKVNDLAEISVFEETKLRGFQNFSLISSKSIDLDVIKEKLINFESCMDSYEFLILKCLRIFDEDGAPLWQLEKELHTEGLSADCIKMFLKKIKESPAGIFLEYSATKWKLLDDSTPIAEIVSLYGTPTKPALLEPEHKINESANHVFVTKCRDLAETIELYYKSGDVQIFETKDSVVSIRKKNITPTPIKNKNLDLELMRMRNEKRTTEIVDQAILIFAKDFAKNREEQKNIM